MCDICIVRTEDGLDWSDFLERIFTNPEEIEDKSGPYDVRIVSIVEDGAKHMIKPPVGDLHLCPKESHCKFLVVLATPNLIKSFHDNIQLEFWEHDTCATKTSILFCGIEPVRMFELDKTGRTLSSRFRDYSNWSKYDHNVYESLVASATSWIRYAVGQDGKDPDDSGKQQNGLDEDDDDNSYIDMKKSLSDNDSSKTGSGIVRHSSSDDGDDYIGRNTSTIYGLSDTYGIAIDRESSLKNSRPASFEQKREFVKTDEFCLVPGEAMWEDVTTITVVFKEPPLRRSQSDLSGSRKLRNFGRDFKVALVDDNYKCFLDLHWINESVAHFKAPSHHLGPVQVKIYKGKEDIFGGGVELEYKRSSGVEELVADVSQIYIHLLATSFNLIKSLPNISSGSFSSLTSSSSPSYGSHSTSLPRGTLTASASSLIRLDKNLSDLFGESPDSDQFNVRAFEYFFGAYNHFEDITTTEFPTLFHLAAKFNLLHFAVVLLDLPDSAAALSVKNSSTMTPSNLAKSLGHTEIFNLYQECLNGFTAEPKEFEEADDYIDMTSKLQNKRPEIKVSRIESEAGANENEQDSQHEDLQDESQEALKDIMKKFINRQILLEDVPTLFQQWHISYPQQDQNKERKVKQKRKTKGFKDIRTWLIAGSKKAAGHQRGDVSPNSASQSKHRASRNSGHSDEILPAVPPRPNIPDEDKSKLPIPHPPSRKSHNHYLQLIDRDREDDHEDDAPARPPPRRPPLKNAKQSSFPAQLNPPVPEHIPRKCSLPENTTRYRHTQFTSRLDSTSEHSEPAGQTRKDNAEKNHGYVCMTSKTKPPQDQ